MLDEARYDSSGAFTVDWSRLHESYRGLLKLEPDLYLCKIFQAVVAAQATRLDIRVDRSQIVFDWNTETQLQEQQGHLAIGLHLAATRADLKITLYSGSHSLLWPQKEFSRLDPRHEGTRLVVTSSRWRPLASLKWPEFAHFRARLGYQPLKLRINGSELAVGGAGTLATQARYLAEPVVGEVGLDLADGPDARLLEGDPSDRCVQYIHLNANVGVSNPYSMLTHYSEDVLVFVQDGLPVYRSNRWLGRVGMFMVVANNRLPTDASTLNLVEGTELAAALVQARQDAEGFLAELEERFSAEENPQLAAALRSRFLRP